MAAQSLDVLRKQARHRLIGATVLVLLAVIGFPLVFDTKPREVDADIRIDMPDKERVRSNQPPAPPAAAPVADVDLAANAKPVEVVEKPSQPQAIEEELPPEPAQSKKTEDAAPRFIVQVGAFEQDSKAKEVRAKLEKAGIKTYTHIAQTKEGKRIRVRVGPFATKEEAQKTVDKIKSLQLSAAVLTI